MPISFTSEALRLKNLFDRRFQYTIPIYQRPYSWTDKQSTRLLDDIVDAMSNENGSTEADRSCFLGAIILTGNMEETIKKPLSGKLVDAFRAIVSGKQPLPEHIRGDFDVVDGKQRLVTLKILLCLLRDLSDNGDDSRFLNSIGDGGTGNPYRLELCGGESAFLEKYVLQRGAALAPIPDQDNMSDSERKMATVRDSMHQNLLNLSGAERHRLLEFILDHCEVVIILSERFDHAFKIFLSINDTGEMLNEGDILKAELMANLTPEIRERYADIWRQWNDSLGEARSKAESRDKTFFNHFRYVLTSNPVNILEDFRAAVDRAGGAEPFIENDLIPNIRAYEIILEESWPYEKHKKEMDRILGTLNWLPHDDWMAPAMLAITRFADDPDQGLALFRKLEQLAYGLMILPGKAVDRRKKYNPLKRGLRGEENKDPFVEVELSKVEKKAVRRIMERGLHKSKPAAARLLLLRLDMAVSGRPASFYNALAAEETLSVEHLLPLNPEPDSQWLSDFSDQKMRLFNTELLGNLFLVRETSENALMKNHDFNVKKNVLFGEDNRDHPIQLTNELKQQTEWTLNDIARRQERLLTVLDEIWPL